MLGESLEKLIAKTINSKYTFKKLAGDGSNREIFLIEYQAVKKIIAVKLADTQLNLRFINYSKFFFQKGLPVANIMAVAEDNKSYLTDYLGPKTFAESIPNLDKKNLLENYKSILPYLMDFSRFGLELLKQYPERVMSVEFLNRDLAYFKKEFVDFLQLKEYFTDAILESLKNLVKKILSLKSESFVYRDFQARNIILTDNKFYFIDYQDGLLGPFGYDLASLLYAGSSGLDKDDRNFLLAYFIKNYGYKNEFKIDFYYLALMRKIHSLATYAKLGLKENRPNFKGKLMLNLSEIQEILTTENKIYSDFKELASFFEFVTPKIDLSH